MLNVYPVPNRCDANRSAWAGSVTIDCRSGLWETLQTTRLELSRERIVLDRKIVIIDVANG